MRILIHHGEEKNKSERIVLRSHKQHVYNIKCRNYAQAEEKKVHFET